MKPLFRRFTQFRGINRRQVEQAAGDDRVGAGDARYRSGWSVTVAAALLREAGSAAVLPLVLHQLP